MKLMNSDRVHANETAGKSLTKLHGCVVAIIACSRKRAVHVDCMWSATKWRSTAARHPRQESRIRRFAADANEKAEGQ